MKNKRFLLLIGVLFTVSCLNNKEKENKSLSIENGSDVIVTLNMAEKKNVVKIEFSSNDSIIFVEKKEIIEHDLFIYSFDNKGEGTFKVCIYKLNDTICSENYIEKGYEPKLKFEKDSLIVTDFIGSEY